MNKTTWTVDDTWLQEYNDLKKTWENTTVSTPTQITNTITINTNLYDRLERLEKLVKKMEEFLNKFFDTEINKERK